MLQRIYDVFEDVPVVSISDAQRQPVPHANYVGTIHHGVPERSLLPGFGAGGYLAFLGRISPEKAPDAAIRIAQKAGMPIRLAAKVDKVDRQYFEETVKPLLSAPGVEFIGEISDDQKSEFLGNAAALLFPIAWPEPFGLAIRRASVPEIVDDGITGFIVDSEEQAAEAATCLGRLDRARVRRVFEERFTARRMAEDYLNVYRRLIARDQPLRQAV